MVTMRDNEASLNAAFNYVQNVGNLAASWHGMSGYQQGYFLGGASVDIAGGALVSGGLGIMARANAAAMRLDLFGLRGGYGVLGEKGLKLGNYRLDLMYANPSAGQGAGTIFSLKQMKPGGVLWRWDYGKLHTTGNMGLHSTVRFYWYGVKYGSTAQRTWYPSTLKAPFFKVLE